MKAMKWGSTHTDIYSFDDNRWIKIECRLTDSGMDCTAPRVLPRGTKFSYNVKPTRELEAKAERAQR